MTTISSSIPCPTSARIPGYWQYDISLVHNIEKYTGTALGLCSEVVEDDVLKLLNAVAKASRVAKIRLMEQVRPGRCRSELLR